MLRYKGKFIKKQQLCKIKNNISLINEVNRTHVESKTVSTVTNEATNDESDSPGSDSNIQWSDGRRVVDLKELAKGLNSCKKCTHQLNLLDTVKESREGLGSVLHVKCDVCATINEVRTGNKHGESGRGVFDVNSKAAVGKII